MIYWPFARQDTGPPGRWSETPSIGFASTLNRGKVTLLDMTQIIDDPTLVSPTGPIHPRKPEIMSPAGYWPQLQAAIEAGADAVYFGLKHFTARAKVGFSLAELPDVMRTLHQRGVKGYVTFNTLVFDHELAEAARSLAAIAETGADSIIVQDVGIAQLASRSRRSWRSTAAPR